jgi:hypothetical protein
MHDELHSRERSSTGCPAQEACSLLAGELIIGFGITDFIPGIAGIPAAEKA